MKYLTTLKLPIYCAALTLIFLSTSCDKEEVLTPEQTIAGNWAGLVSQPGYDDFSLEVSIADPIVGRVVGTGNYDGECTFNWTYLRQEQETYFFDEKILTGRDYCVDGVIQISFISDNSLKYYWLESASDDNSAEGTLTRQ